MVDMLNTDLEEGAILSEESIDQNIDDKLLEDDLQDKELEEGEEDDDSDSDLEIIMDQAPQNKSNDTRNSLVNIKPNSYNKQIGPLRNESSQPTPLTSRIPGVDLNAIGTIDGTSIYDVDLDSVEEKPWRKPGADITDYFNYGFNEYSWKTYCAKQKQMREDQHSRKKIHVFETKQEINLPPELQSIAQPQSSEHMRFQQQQQQHHHHHHHHQQQQHQQHQQHQHHQQSQQQQNQQQQQQQMQQRGGRGRRGRDQDDSVIQVVSSEREAVLEEMDPIPPLMMDKLQNDEFGPPMAMGMFTEVGVPSIGRPPPFFMGNTEIPPSGPMGFDPNYRGGQPVRAMLHPSGITGGLPSNMTGNISGNIPNMSGRIPSMPSSMPGNIPVMTRAISGMSGNMTGNMVGRNERPFFPMEDQGWEIEKRNVQTFRPSTFPGRPPPTGGHIRSREEERWDNPRKRTINEMPRGDDDDFRNKRRH